MSWWQRFRAWLGLSEPGLRKEELEDWIATNNSIFAQIHAEQASGREPRGGYRQLRKQDRYVASLPTWAEFAVHVYEAPVTRAPRTTHFGYTSEYRVTELDGSVWVLSVDPDGVSPVWVEIAPLPVI